MSFFDSSTWVACFVEFFYGDCAPNLNRPVKIGWRRLFRYLMNREELEYHLPSDQNDPTIPGGRYTGCSSELAERIVGERRAWAVHVGFLMAGAACGAHFSGHPYLPLLRAAEANTAEARWPSVIRSMSSLE